MYLPPSKVLFLIRSFPVSLGALTPGEPLVGAAFQSETGAGAAAGAAAPGAVPAAAAGGGVAGDAGTIMADEAGSHPAADTTAKARAQKASAHDPVAPRRTIISGIFSTLGGRSRQEHRPRDATPKG